MLLYYKKINTNLDRLMLRQLLYETTDSTAYKIKMLKINVYCILIELRH